MSRAMMVEPTLTEKPLVGASFEELEAEIRRVCEPGLPKPKTFYNPNPKRGRPHVTDPPVLDHRTICSEIYERRFGKSHSQST